ncbi:MAG: efflux RND transporter periplasmic adaptor subunit [Casimicrobiaceae bacterium]
MTRPGMLLLAMALAAGPALAASVPSVQVETVALKQQPVADTVAGYGTVSPAPRALHTISVSRAGRVVEMSVSPGQVVKKGETLLVFGTDPGAAMAFLQTRQAVDFARGDVARTEQLFARQLATRSQLASARKALVDAEAALRAQEQVGAGRPVERVAAAFDAVVVGVQAAQGDRLAAGAPVLQLARAGAQRVVLGIEPEDAARVRPGMAVRVTSVFGPGREVAARVARVSGVIDPRTQFVDVIVDVPGGRLMPGTRVRASIELGERPAWVVPRSAVLRDSEGAYIFQVRDGRAHRIPVQAGTEQAGEIAVDGQFDAGAPVVSLGNYELQDGMAVRGGGR